MLLQVRTTADPVHYGKQAGGVQGGQHAVPDAAVQVDRLTARSDECLRYARFSIVVRRDDDQKRVLGHRDERLRSVRVPFQQIAAIGQGAWLGVKDADPRLSVAEIQQGPVVIAPAKPCVNQFVRR